MGVPFLTGFAVFSMGVVSAQGDGLCQPGLVVQATEAISRSHETLPIQFVITENPLEIPFAYFDLKIVYPENANPLSDTVRAIPPPKGIFRDVKTNETIVLKTASDRLISVLIDLIAGPQSHGTYVAKTGPAIEIPFEIAASPGPLPFTITSAQVASIQEPCNYADPTPFTVQVTGSGTGIGDLDGDGKVTVADAQWSLKLALHTATASPGVVTSADVSPPGGDGKVTLADMIQTLRLAVGLE